MGLMLETIRDTHRERQGHCRETLEPTSILVPYLPYQLSRGLVPELWNSLGL